MSDAIQRLKKLATQVPPIEWKVETIPEPTWWWRTARPGSPVKGRFHFKRPPWTAEVFNTVLISGPRRDVIPTPYTAVVMVKP